ncbi:uncharacterized protein LOC117599236 [Pangasianodon hypophthalmus]|uniref:uncharacterized protein LOC117599236 n=1 Tax=Pangasianodon hypophthalmus TaxID=310915 RepID=UPI0023073F48|nr:uncharacterized protein LOC117599236 [Pangasianodon hypophthalmus]
MARVSLLCYLGALVWSCAADLCLNSCSLTSKNISYTCKNISTGTGYTFRVPQSVPTECLKRCEHGWYHKNNTFLADSKEPHVGNLPEPIVEVTLWSLTTYTCLDGPYWKMDCQCSRSANFVASYVADKSFKDLSVKNDEAETCSYNATFHFLWLLSIPVFMMVALLVWYCKRKGRAKRLSCMKIPGDQQVLKCSNQPFWHHQLCHD